jgi:hypothetical protein
MSQTLLLMAVFLTFSACNCPTLLQPLHYKKQVMKKILLIFLLMPVIGNAQKCKYDKDEFDKFQKLRKIEKESKLTKGNLDGNGRFLIRLCKYDSTIFFRIVYQNYSSMVVGKQDAVIFLLSNNKTIKAYANNIYASQYRHSMSEILNATYMFENVADIEDLKKEPITSIRIFYNQVYKDMEVTPKFANDFMETVKCF